MEQLRYTGWPPRRLLNLCAKILHFSDHSSSLAGFITATKLKHDYKKVS